jgi:hypothetical protein
LDHRVHAATADGWHAITGTSKGQIFHYFPGGKEELLLSPGMRPTASWQTSSPHLGAARTTWAAWERDPGRYPDDARFVHGTVLDVHGGRTGVALIAA